MSDSDRDAVDIYVRIRNLQAVGGTDYRTNLTQLKKDAALWMQQSSDTLHAISTWIDILNANDNGAGLSTDPRSLLTSAKCLGADCLGKEQTRGIKDFLKCAINTLGKPD